jgi:hypothetical protein
MFLKKAGGASPKGCEFAGWNQMLPVIDLCFPGFHFDDQEVAAFGGNEVEFEGFAAEILSDDAKAAVRKPVGDQGFSAAGAFIP